MSDAESVVPHIAIQKTITERLLAKRLILNDVWYLVSYDWFQNFRSYVHLNNTWAEGCDYPGPIDNSLLYKGDVTDIKDHLIKESNYVLVPEELWNLLVKWYGMVKGQPPIARKVVECNKNCEVEVYPVPLRLRKVFNTDVTCVHKFSKGDTIGHIAKVARKLFGISDDEDVRVLALLRKTFDVELNLNKTVEDEHLFPNQEILIEVRRPDVTWIKPAKKISDAEIGSVTPGLCGLYRIGYTCFMNSVIQCLSNCPPLVEHFIEEKYLNDLNTENPIGMKGKIALAFGELIKIMWSGKHSFTMPSNLKEQVSIFAPLLLSSGGVQQQDAHEFLTFLLDGLHEDLNRIKQKLYIEMRDSDGRPDEVVAAEAWEIYKKRNDSIIVDYFHGLLKSTVVCPDCAKVSLAFDPFCNLSLPLPIRTEREIQVTYFPSDVLKKPRSISRMVPREGLVKELLYALGLHFRVNPDQLIVAKIAKHHFHKFFSRKDPLESIDPREDVIVYEVPRSNSYVPVPLVFWEVNSRQSFSFSQLFGYPMIVMLPKENCTYQDIYQAVLIQIYRYLNLPNGCCNNNTDAANAGTRCKCKTPENVSSLLPDDLFSLHVVSSSTASVVYKLHKDSNHIQIPNVRGRQFLAAQWTTDHRKKFLKPVLQIVFDGGNQMLQKHSQVMQLKDCLELFTMCETLGDGNAWHCPFCKQKQRTTKKFDLWKLPKILVIHLKRFSNNRFRQEKIDALVEFPLRDLDMSKYVTNDKHPTAKYNLIGVCNHEGGMENGHYSAYAFNKITKKWYYFDDQKIYNVSPESVVTNAAYVLFYIRSDLQMV